MEENKSASGYQFANNCKKLFKETDKETLFGQIKQMKDEHDAMRDELAEIHSKESKTRKFFRTFDASQFFGSPQIVLLFSLALLLAQSFHTWHFFYTISVISGVTGFIFALITSIFIDGLILFFVARGAKFYSVVAMLCTITFNIYSYMINEQGVFEWGSNNILFSMIASVSVPFFLHGVGIELSKIKMEKTNKNGDI